MDATGILTPDENDRSKPSKDVASRDSGDGRFTLAERKEIISKRKIVEYQELETERVDLWDFQPKSPEQMAVERSFLRRWGEVAGAALSVSAFAEVAGAFALKSQGLPEVVLFPLLALGGLSAALAGLSFDKSNKAEIKLKRLNKTRTVLVPRSVRQAYQTVKSSARSIEEGDHPPDVIAAARLSLEGVQSHVRLIATHTELGTVKSQPCQELLGEVYRIAAEMDTYLELDRQEKRERKQREEAEMEAALLERIGSSPEAERTLESIQRTRGLTF